MQSDAVIFHGAVRPTFNMDANGEVETTVLGERRANRDSSVPHTLPHSFPALYLRSAHLSRLFLGLLSQLMSQRLWTVVDTEVREAKRWVIFVTPVPTDKFCQDSSFLQLIPIILSSPFVCQAQGWFSAFPTLRVDPLGPGQIPKLVLHMQSQFPVLISCVLNTQRGLYLLFSLHSDIEAFLMQVKSELSILRLVGII